MIKNDCMLNLPYPKIDIKEKNLKYAKIILENYAGCVSELTAITQYLYHKLKLSKSYPEISKILLKISMVEMHHLDILGEMVEALGGDPGYWINKKNKHHYWNAKFVDYCKSPASMIKADIEGEKKAIKQYECSIKLIDNENINSILRRIILDEEFHIKILSGIYEKYFM